MRVAAAVEYFGDAYQGWQRQSHAPSIQEFVESALSSIAGHQVRVQCAGRTDSGVHALHQVFHFDTTARRPDHSWVLGGNTKMPQDISLLWAQHVAEDFNARFSATSRVYRYVIQNRRSRPGILNKRVTWECRPLDVGRMAAAGAALIGEHDFSSYRALACQARSPIREIRRLDVVRCGEFVIIDVEANAFLHHMVRNIAGVLMAIGLGHEDITWAGELLGVRDRARAAATAPAGGLYLLTANFPDKYCIPQPQTENFWPAKISGR